MLENTEFQEAFDKGVASASVKQIDGNNFLVVPKGCSVESLEQFEKLPRRMKVNRTFTEIDSFIRYVNGFKNDHTLIVGEPFQNRFHAIIDYHAKGMPQWCGHSANFSPIISKEWETWNKYSGEKFIQSDFLEFLEDHMENIKTPSGAEIMELCTHLEGTKTVNFKSGIKQQDGAINLQWEENFEGKGSQAGNITIPPDLTLVIRPFEKGIRYEVKAWLRYRIREGRLVFFYKLVNPEKVIEDAFDAFLKTIEEKTTITPLLGTI